MIIVNSAAILDELEKKGSPYSDRPVLEMGSELAGYSQTLVLIAYGARFRTYRKHLPPGCWKSPLYPRVWNMKIPSPRGYQEI